MAYGADQLFPSAISKSRRCQDKGAVSHRHADENTRGENSKHDADILEGNAALLSKNPNKDLIRTLFDMKSVERAAGNILVSDIYDEAIRYLTPPSSLDGSFAEGVNLKKIASVADIQSVLKGASRKAKAIVERLFLAQEHRRMKGGLDIMEQADILVQQGRDKVAANVTAESVHAEATRQRLLVVLEEEQERERERESFWWSKTTQSRPVEEQRELARIFDEERESAAARIMHLTSSVAGLKSSLAFESTDPASRHDAEREEDGEEAEAEADRLADLFASSVHEFFDEHHKETNSLVEDSSVMLGKNNPEDLERGADHSLPPVPAARNNTSALLDGRPPSSSTSSIGLPSVHSNISQVWQNEDSRSTWTHSKEERSLENTDHELVMKKMLKPFNEDIDTIEQEESQRKKKPFLILVHPKSEEAIAEEKKRAKREKRKAQERDTLAKEKLSRESLLAEKAARFKAVRDRQMRAKERHETSMLLKNRDFANKLKVKNIQSERLRQRPRVVYGSTDIGASVLDDPDSIGLVRQAQSVQFESVVKEGPPETFPDAQPSSGIFWGRSMELMGSGQEEFPMHRMASTTTGGGVFWGSWVEEDSDLKSSVLHDRELRESNRNMSMGGHASSSEFPVSDQVESVQATIDNKKGIEEAPVHPIEVKVRMYRLLHRGARLSDRIAKFDLRGKRNPGTGGLGKRQHDVGIDCGDPMFTCSTHVRGSINQGRGAFAIVTVYDGGTSDPVRKTDIVMRAYMPATSETLTVRITRAEASLFLNKSTVWYQASDVQDGKASMQYMRPYWKEKISPIVKRLQIHQQMIGGENFVSRDLFLDVDRCILSRTSVLLTPFAEQQHAAQSAFPKESAVVIRIEKSLEKKKTKAGPTKYNANGEPIVEPPKDWEVHEGPPGSDTITFAVTVVFSRRNGRRDTLRKSLSLATLTRYLKLPKKPMVMVAEAQLEAILDALVRSVRLVFLSPKAGDPTDDNGRFRRYSAGEAIAEAEIDLLFHWQKPSRRAIHIDETGEGKVDYEKLAEKEAKEEGDRRSSAAVKIQSAFRGMVGRAIFKVEVERQRRLANESAEKIQCAYRGMVGRKIFKQKWLEKGLLELEAEETELERQRELEILRKMELKGLVHWIEAREMEIDGKNVSLEVQVKAKPTLSVFFRATMLDDIDSPVPKLTVSSRDKLDPFIAYLTGFETVRSGRMIEVDHDLDYVALTEVMIERLQLFKSRANNILVLSIREPEPLHNDVFLNIDAGGMKTPPRPTNIPALDMTSVKKSKQRRRRISLGLEPLSAKERKKQKEEEVKERRKKKKGDKLTLAGGH